MILIALTEILCLILDEHLQVCMVRDVVLLDEIDVNSQEFLLEREDYDVDRVVLPLQVRPQSVVYFLLRVSDIRLN